MGESVGVLVPQQTKDIASRRDASPPASFAEARLSRIRMSGGVEPAADYVVSCVSGTT